MQNHEISLFKKSKKAYSQCLFLDSTKLRLTIFTFKKYLLVIFLATREAVAPLANDPIMLGRSIWLFRHLKHKNLSFFSDYVGIPNRSKKNGKMSEKEEEEQERNRILFI